MNRQQLLTQAWIDVRKVLPPEDRSKPEKQVLCWLPRYKIAVVHPQNLARMDAQRFLEQVKDDIPFTDWAWDRVFTHWMPICHPERK